MPIREIKEKDLVWINIDQVDDASMQYLKDRYHFHHLDLEDVQSEQQIPKIDVYPDYIFLVLRFPHWDHQKKMIIAEEVDIFVGHSYLITIQTHKSRELRDFFYRCLNNRSVRDDWMNENSGYLLYRLIEALFHNTRPILNNLGKLITEKEDEIFRTAEPDTGLVMQLAHVRRNVLGFRRIIDPQRHIVSHISTIKHPLIDESLRVYFDNVNDYLNNIWSIVETYKETIDGFHLTVESLLNRRINKIISTLTVISVSLLPLTLLSGIYGMNIPLPFREQPHIVWIQFGILIAVIATIIFFLQKRKYV